MVRASIEAILHFFLGPAGAPGLQGREGSAFTMGIIPGYPEASQTHGCREDSWKEKLYRMSEWKKRESSVIHVSVEMTFEPLAACES